MSQTSRAVKWISLSLTNRNYVIRLYHSVLQNFYLRSTIFLLSLYIYTHLDFEFDNDKLRVTFPCLRACLCLHRHLVSRSRPHHCNNMSAGFYPIEVRTLSLFSIIPNYMWYIRTWCIRKECKTINSKVLLHVYEWITLKIITGQVFKIEFDVAITQAEVFTTVLSTHESIQIFILL